MTRRTIFKVVGAVFMLLLTGAVGLYGWLDHRAQRLSVDRNEEYLSRLNYLWEGVKWPGSAPRATTDPAMLKAFGTLYNPTMERGPNILAFPVDADEPTTAVLIFPGGAYAMRSEELEGARVARWFNENGISAFYLNYRLGRHPEPLDDARLAVSYIRRHSERWGIDPTRLGVLGFSAGGHLAASLANLYDELAELPTPYNTYSSRPDFVVLAYPVISFEPDLDPAEMRFRLLGENPDSDLLNLLSVEQQVSSDTPPTFIWAPATDEAVPHRNSVLYSEVLSAKGVENELHIFPEGAHGSDLAEEEPHASHWPGLLLTWMAGQGLWIGPYPVE